MPEFDHEVSRIREAYARRDASGKAASYAPTRPDVAYTVYRKARAWARAFRRAGVGEIGALDVLDVGCGAGGWLRMLAEWGADPARLHGIDLLGDRIDAARALGPAGIDYQAGPGWPIPFDDSSVDIVAASTVFSSILDIEARGALAAEMVRVARPGRWVMIYDFAVSSPGNPDTTGISKDEIRRLFAGLQLLPAIRVTLAPPLVRALPARLLWLAHLLEDLLPLLCTHRLYVMQKAFATDGTAR